MMRICVRVYNMCILFHSMPGLFHSVPARWVSRQKRGKLAQELVTTKKLVAMTFERFT